MASKTPLQMTRRFSIAEKLTIIEKSKVLGNISATCRWVRNEFNRPTFARKSLSDMVSKEEVYRKAVGTKRVKKSVKAKSGWFPRKDKELAA